MKIVTIIGARPQFVKAAVVSRAIQLRNRQYLDMPLNEIIVHTGQHYDYRMSDIFIEELRLPAIQYHLGIHADTHGAMIGRMIEQIEAVLQKEKPDLTLVYGDTDSTLAGALAAVHSHIPVAHIEAGMRSFNPTMPEEINRILTDRISHWLFCSSAQALKNLEQERVGLHHPLRRSAPVMRIVGDVMIDAVMLHDRTLNPAPSVSQLIGKQGSAFYVATVHRAENTDDPVRLSAILQALDAIAQHTPVILPLHPRTKKAMQAQGIAPRCVQCIEPVGYRDMLSLVKACRAVFTDSGGLQKEAYFYRKICITLREATEWIELVEHGMNVVVGADIERILEAEQRLTATEPDWDVQLYGDGHAAEKVVNFLTA